MTLTVGILAKDGIVIACDSRMISSASSNDAAEKIFQLGEKVVAGIAGDGLLASHLFDLIKKENKIDFSEDIVYIAEALCERLAIAFDKYYPQLKPQERNQLQIILAGYTKDAPPLPSLYYLDSDDNFVPRQCMEGHQSIGNINVSQYILNRFYAKGNLLTEKAKLMSVFCIRQTMAETPKVGGKIKVAYFSDKKEFSIVNNNDVVKMIDRCRNMQNRLRNNFYPEEETFDTKAYTRITI